MPVWEKKEETRNFTLLEPPLNPRVVCPQTAGPGGGSLPLYRALLRDPDDRGDGQRRLPHRLLRHHRHGVPEQRGHHLRKYDGRERDKDILLLYKVILDLVQNLL